MVHLHLMAAHVPVIGILLLIPLLLIALARQSEELSKASVLGNHCNRRHSRSRVFHRRAD